VLPHICTGEEEMERERERERANSNNGGNAPRKRGDETWKKKRHLVDRHTVSE
jgi:hypothetical protein